MHFHNTIKDRRLKEELKLNLQGMEVVGENSPDGNRTVVIEPNQEASLLLRWTSNEVAMTPTFAVTTETVLKEDDLIEVIKKDGKLKEFEAGAG